MDLHKILKIVVLILSLVGAVFALMIMAGDDETASNMSGNMLLISYIVLALAIGLVLIFVVKGLFTGDVKNTLLYIGAFLAIVVISYIMASGTDLDLTPFTNKGQDITETTSKIVGTSLYTFYALAVLAIGSMLYGGVKKTFNK